MAVACDQHEPVAGDLEAQQRRGVVQPHEINRAAGRASEGDFQRRWTLGPRLHGYPEIDVAVRSRGSSDGRAKYHGEPHALAAHPDDVATVAVATSTGVYLSRDSGGRFAAIAAGSEGLAAFFDLDGKHLWYGAFNGRARLARIPIPGGLPVQMELPALERDAVAYIAQNPRARGEYAIATFGRSVYLSRDGARTWKQIAERGEAK